MTRFYERTLRIALDVAFLVVVVVLGAAAGVDLVSFLRDGGAQWPIGINNPTFRYRTEWHFLGVNGSEVLVTLTVCIGSFFAKAGWRRTILRGCGAAVLVVATICMLPKS